MQTLTDSLRREQMRPAGLRIPRIAVLSDQGLYRDGIVEILRQHGFKRVDGFGDCESLIETARAAPPDLTLVDLAHEREDAQQVARRLRATWPNLTIVAIGTPVQLAARAVGVDGCVEIPTDGSARLFAMAEAVARRHHGPIKFSVSPELSRQRLTWASLTPRQRQVLGLLSCGVDNPKIAASLGISERAVKGHVGGLLEKFDVNNRTELALIACHAGVARA